MTIRIKYQAMNDEKRYDMTGDITTRQAIVSTVNDENRTVEVTFATEYPVQRYDGQNRTYFNEVLSFDPSHVDMERMTNGTAPVLNNHMNTGTDGVLGKVESARLEGDHGVAVLRFAKTPDVDNTWEKVRDGILTGVSVGYRVNEYTVEKNDDIPTYRATSWQPLEVSIAPVPADPRSSVRSATEDAVIVLNDIDETDEVVEVVEEVNNNLPTRDAEAKIDKYMKVSLNDLKASRKALEGEFATLDALTERDATQEARYSEVIEKIDTVNADIAREEKAEAIRAARLSAGMATESGEAKEKSEMKKRFSFTESVRDVLNSGSVKGVAREMLDHAMRNGHQGSGQIVIPADFIRAGAADDFQTVDDGSGFVATEVGGFIEGLTAPLMIENWGTQVFNLTSNVQFPRESVKAIATDEGEVDPGAASNMAMDELTLSPKRYHNDTKYSKMLLTQGGPQVESVIAAALRRGHERKLLSDIFSGAASPGIAGILNITGVNDIAAADTGDHSAIALDLEAAVLEDHGLSPNCRYILSPSAYRYFAEAAKVTGVSGVIDQNNLVNGYAYHKTPYLADASTGVGQAIFGDWANAMLAYFGGIDLVIDPYSAKDTAQIEIAMNRFVDFNLGQPAAFAFENGITAT